MKLQLFILSRKVTSGRHNKIISLCVLSQVPFLRGRLLKTWYPGIYHGSFSLSQQQYEPSESLNKTKQDKTKKHGRVFIFYFQPSQFLPKITDIRNY